MTVHIEFRQNGSGNSTDSGEVAMRKSILTIAVGTALGTMAGAGHGSGFALLEQNASNLGNAYAGMAAIAEDASTIWFNPAGMTRLPGRQVVGALHAIRPSADFSNTGSTLAPAQVSLGGNGGDGGDWAAVPNGYLSWQVNPNLFLGVALNVPFGLTTNWDAGWVGRFHSLKSELKTININPSIAFKVNDMISIGGGISYQMADAELTQSVNYSAAAAAAGVLGAVGVGSEGVVTIKGSDESWGFNLGVLFNASADTRFGVSYRSSINYKLAGTASFTNRPAILGAGIPDSNVTADVKMPSSVSASVFHRLNSKWDVMADISWTDWSTIGSLNIMRSNGALAGRALTSLPLNWSDTWRFSVGATYHVDDRWSLRFGAAYDESPVPDVDRTPRIPDQDRTWLALGAQFRLSKTAALDFGYVHVFVKDASSNLCPPAAAATFACAGRNNLVGNYEASVDIISAQLTYKF